MKMKKIQDKWLAYEIAIPRLYNEMFPKKIKIVLEGLYQGNSGYKRFYARYFIDCDTMQKQEIENPFYLDTYHNGDLQSYYPYSILISIYQDVYMRGRFRAVVYDITGEIKKTIRKEKLKKIFS